MENLPFRLEADAPQQRDMGREQLGDATPVRGGAEVQDPRAAQRLRGLPDRRDDVVTDDGAVVVELLLEKRDTLQHSRSI